MSLAAKKSPFNSQMEDCDWLLWQAETPLFPLLQTKQTDGRSVCEECICSKNDSFDRIDIRPASASLRRNQYNAVLNRFDVASKRAGSYSAWNT